MASEQSEPKRCECYRCSGRGWKTVLVDAGPAQKVTCKLCGGDGEIEAPECRCGWCHWSGVFWLARGGTPVSHCPDKCGCRLSVVDGQPVVGEAYADLERDAKRFRAVENAMGPPLDSPFNMHRWHFETDGMDTRYATLGEYADALRGGETGAVEVSPSVEKLLAALALELADHGDCPMDYSDWPCPATPETHDCEMGPAALCWLIYYGLADTYAEAAVLWARMEEASREAR